MLLGQLMHLLVNVATWIKYHFAKSSTFSIEFVVGIVYMNFLKQFGILYLFVIWALKVDYLLASQLLQE